VEAAQPARPRDLLEEAAEAGAGLAGDPQGPALADDDPGQELAGDAERQVPFEQARRGRPAVGLHVVGDRAGPAAVLGQVVAPVRGGEQALGVGGVVRERGHAQRHDTDSGGSPGNGWP
jgi:hypothetical protein